MLDGPNYTITTRTGADGTLFVLIREAPVPRRWSVRRWMPALVEGLTMLKVSFQKALRLASRRAS
jgi:hypothetical protein